MKTIHKAYSLQYRYSHQRLWTTLENFQTAQQAFDNITNTPKLVEPDKTLHIRIVKHINVTYPFSISLFEGKILHPIIGSSYYPTQTH